MPEKLKPCPFCGGKAELVGDCDMLQPRCCNFRCGASFWFDDTEDATTSWNRRVSDTTQDKPQGWIPVTERLPEKDKYVLLFMRNEERTMITAGKIYNSEDAKFDGEFCLGLSETEPEFLKREYITHWRELPEPPVF